jgi:PucR family transcriptional regulator, purine catabolism regulatory protein
MPVTISRLVAEPAFRLTLRNPSAALDEPLTWLSSSDLPDPSPFLLPGQVVLTTGLQFEHFDDGDFVDYVRRLRSAGVLGIGFGAEVVRARTPDALLRAGQEVGLAVVEVPYEVPFVALITWAARELSRDAAARSDWALSAQRAISLAAVSGGGVSAALLETARQLDGTVVLFDSDGEFVEQQPATRLPAPVNDVAHEEVRRLLARRRRAGGSQRVSGHDVVVQTLGRSDRPRGALALASSGALDPAARAVLMTGIALVEVAREQDAADSAALAAIRAHVVRLLRTGSVAPARDLLDEASAAGDVGRLDLERDVVVLVSGGGADGDEIRRQLRRTARKHVRTRFAAIAGGRLVALADADSATWLVDAAERQGVPAGLSGAHPLAGFERALSEAESAYAQATARGGGVLTWGEAGSSRLLGYLEGTGLSEAAASRLAALGDDEGELVRLTRLWFLHNCRWETAGEAAGLHRHGLRARLERVARALDLDLDSFADRAELWAVVSLSET